MELEFDKEIDALLRKANRASPSSAAAPAAGHLDADELAAFAENALPVQSRQMYTTHLADCDACRTALSSFVASEPEKMAAAAAAFAPARPSAAGESIPWYQRIFRAPNLAYVVGGLVVLFTGMIGLLVYQSQLAGRNAQVSQTMEARSAAEPPSTTMSDVSSANANASANTITNTASSSPIESVTKSGVAVGSTNSATLSVEEKPQIVTDGVAANEPQLQKPAAAAPALIAKDAPREQPKADLDEKERNVKSEDKKLAENESGNRMDNLNTNNTRDMAPGALSARRAEGPRQVQSQINQSQLNDLPRAKTLSSLRTAGGKKLELRDGVWYDTAYTGQGKKDYKRGTEKYIRLDAGLRAIADEIGGTVVIVWNGQAYRIK